MLIFLYWALFHFSSSLETQDDISGGQLLYEKYELQEADPKACMSEDGVPHIANLLVEISRITLQNQVPVLLYDNHYFINLKFQKILGKILRLYPKSLRHGVINTTMAVPRVSGSILDASGNEQFAFIVFIKDIEIGAIAIVEKIKMETKAIFISQSSLYQMKDFLASDLARRFNNIMVLIDPTLKVDTYFQKQRVEMKKCDINLYTHSLSEDTLGGSSFKLLTAWRKDNFTNHVDLFPNKFKRGFNGVHIVITASEIPPYVFRSRGHDSGDGYTVTKWDGLEVRLLNLIGNMLNFSVEYKEPEIDQLNVNLSVADNSLRELSLRKVDYAIGGIFLTAERYKDFAFTHPYSHDCASFISLTSTALPKYRAIMGPFLWDVWLALTSVYLLAIFPIAFSVWHTLKPLMQDFSELENMFWYVFGTFTNCFTFSGKNSWSQGSMSATRLFIGSYWVFTIIITACYTGSIIAFITMPVFPEVIDTSKQLLKKDFKISTLDSDGWETLFSESVDPIAHRMYKDLDLVPNLIDGLKNVTRNVHSDRQSAFLGSKKLLEFTVRTNYTPDDSSKQLLFHMSKECFVPLLVSMAVPKKSIHLEKLNLALARAIQSGFMFKITREVEWTAYKMSTARLLQTSRIGIRRAPEDRQLTLDDTQGMFLLLGAGFAIAFAVLTTEIITWCVKEIKSRKFGQLSLKTRSINKIKQNLNGITKCLFDPIDVARSSFYYMKRRASNVSSLFGSNISFAESRKSTMTVFHLKPPEHEKPIRLRSF